MIAVDELAPRRRRRRSDDEGTIPDQRVTLVHLLSLRSVVICWAAATVLLALVAVVLAVTR